MPTYKFKCSNCGHEFEKLFLSQNEITDKLKCPECGEEAKKQFTASSVSVGTGNHKWDKEIAEDPEEYREMHYHEKKGNWKKAAKAAEGVSDFAKEKFEKKAREEGK